MPEKCLSYTISSVRHFHRQFAAPNPTGAASLMPPYSGFSRCPYRRFRFTIGCSGRVTAHPETISRPKPRWFLDAETKSRDLEAKLRPYETLTVEPHQWVA